MSSRQLRKIQQQRELEKQAKREAADEEESEDEPVVASRPKPSLFANLAALGDEADDEDAEKSEEEVDQPDMNDPEPAPASASKKAKKSKKKKKAKKKGKEKSAEDETHGTGADDIDAALRELDIKPNSSDAGEELFVPEDPEYQRVCALLGVNTQHLKVATEMRSLFGKPPAESQEDRAERRARQRARAQPLQVDLGTALKGQHAPGKGLAEITLRRNPLIQGKDEWPKATTGGLTMEIVDAKAPDGSIEFKYVHDKTYQAVQTAFNGYVEMGDPQNLIGLLIKNRKFS
jgi:transcription factor 25